MKCIKIVALGKATFKCFHNGKIFLKQLNQKEWNLNGSFRTWCRCKIKKIIYLSDVLWLQKVIKCIIIGKKSLHIGQGDSGKQCGPWASYFFFFKVVRHS
jgi:hypothetical protein